MFKRHLTLIIKVDNPLRLIRKLSAAAREIGGIFTIANNVLMKIRRRPTRSAIRQRPAFGIFGRNTASSPIAGRNAQT